MPRSPARLWTLLSRPASNCFSPCETDYPVLHERIPSAVFFYNYASNQILRSLSVPSGSGITSLAAAVTDSSTAHVAVGLGQASHCARLPQQGRRPFGEALQKAPVAGVAFCVSDSLVCAASGNAVHTWHLS